MYLSMSYSLTYGLSFAAVTAIVLHTYLYNGSEIWARLKNAQHGGEDVHRRLMRAYKEVPDWWYGILTLVTLGLGILTIRFLGHRTTGLGLYRGLLRIGSGSDGTRGHPSGDNEPARISQHYHRDDRGICLAWKADC